MGAEKRCEVCQGTGKLMNAAFAIFPHTMHTGDSLYADCHACNGTGRVEEKSDGD